MPKDDPWNQAADELKKGQSTDPWSQAASELNQDGGSSAGVAGGFLMGAGGQGGLLPNISPVPTSWYGQAWNAITNPTTAGVQLLKDIGQKVGSEALAPALGAYRTGTAVARGDLGGAALESLGMTPGLGDLPDVVRGLWGSEKTQGARASAAAARGDYTLAAAHGALAGVPVLGPQIGGGLEQIRQGQLSGDKGQIAAGVGQLAAIPAGLAVPEALEGGLSLARRAGGAGILSKAMEQRLPGPLNSPALNMTRGDVAQAAQDMGIQLPLGAATGSENVKGMQAVAESSLFGGQRMETVARNNQAALDERWNQMTAQADPRNVGVTPGSPGISVEQVGSDLQDQGKAQFNLEKQAANSAYGVMDQHRPRLGRVSTKSLYDHGLNLAYDFTDPDHPELNTLQPDVGQAVMDALNPQGIGKKQLQKLAGAGPAVPIPAPGAGGMRPNLTAELPAGAAVPGVDGNAFNLKTAGGDMPGTYRVVEADDLNPSHDRRNFNINPDYPAGVQERPYHSDAVEQAKVATHAANYDPSFTINNNPDAVNGPPVILADGTVLGGNGRTMATQRLYDAGGGDIYRRRLQDEAAQFGLDPAQIQGMNKPVLVRQLGEQPATVDDARRIGSDLNKPFTGALSPEASAVSAGRSLTPDTLNAVGNMFDQLGPDASLNDLLESKNARAIWSLLRRDGVVAEADTGRYWDMPGDGFTPAGKAFVKNALLGAAVDDVGILQRAPGSILSRVARTLPEMSRVMARGDEWDISPVVQQALNEHANLNARGITLEDYLKQPIMFGGAPNPAVTAIMQRLGETGPGYKSALGRFASDAARDLPGQAVLPGVLKPEAWRSFNDAFGTRLTEQEYDQARADAENGVFYGDQSSRTGQIPATVGPAQTAGGVRFAPSGAGAGGTQAGIPGGAGGAGPPRGGAAAAGGGTGAAGAGAAGSATAQVAGDNTLNWQSARNVRSYFFNQANDFTGPIRDEGRGVYARNVQLMDNAMEQTAAAAGPDVVRDWRGANALTKAMHVDWSEAGSALRPLLTTPDSQLVQLPNKYLATGEHGGSVAKIQALQDKGIDTSGLQRKALYDIAADKFRVDSNGNLGGYSDDFLRTLLGPQMTDQLYQFGAVKRALGEEFNPSRSGKLLIKGTQIGQAVGAGGALWGHPGAAVVGLGVPWALARGVTSPGLAEYLTQPRGTIGNFLSPQTAAGLRVAPMLARQQDQNQGQ